MLGYIKNKIVEKKNLIIFCLAIYMAALPLHGILQSKSEAKDLEDTLNRVKNLEVDKENFEMKIASMEQGLEELFQNNEEIKKMVDESNEEFTEEIEALRSVVDELEWTVKYFEVRDNMPTAENLETKNKDVINRMEQTDKYNDMIFDYAYAHGFDPLVVKCILYMETAGNGLVFNKNLDENGHVKSVDVGFFQHNFLLKHRVLPSEINNSNFGNYIIYDKYYENSDGEKVKVDPFRLQQEFEYAIDVCMFMIDHKEEIAMDVWESDSKWHLCKAYNGSGEYADKVKKVYEMFGYEFDGSVRLSYYGNDLVESIDIDFEPESTRGIEEQE